MSQKGGSGSTSVAPPKVAAKPHITKVDGAKSSHEFKSEKRERSAKAATDTKVHELPQQVHQMQIHMAPESEWEAREQMCLQELQEARTRAAQMEKTMRWWSDCTANWREKWSKVRNERNRAREEARQLRSKLESAVKECTTVKRERQELTAEVETLRRQLELSQNGAVEREKEVVSDLASTNSSVKSGGLAGKDEDTTMVGPDEAKSDIDFLDKLLQQQQQQQSSGDEKSGGSIKSNGNMNSAGGDRQRAGGHRGLDDPSSGDDSLAEQKVTLASLRLEEADKTLRAERDEKHRLVRESEKLQSEVCNLKGKLDEMKRSKNETLQELNKLKLEHQEQLNRVALDLEDESFRGSSMDRRLADLRAELERLQAENATEWGKRERLETEKLALERDNKKYRTQVSDLEEELEKKNRQTSVMLDSDVKALQKDVHERNKEVSDLKHNNNKYKKVLQDKTTELEHAKRRAEQYELEVKKLRSRVDELKKELAAAEDEVDTQTNNVRKLQRTNEELQEENENLQVQMDHLQSRLRSSEKNVDLFTKRGPAHKTYDPAEDSTTEAFDTDDDSAQEVR